MAPALIGAFVIGVCLGLLGSGGSMLTVPVLVHVVGHHAKQAIAESLAIVGGICIIGAIPYAVSRLVSWRSVVLFGLPGMAGAYLGALVSVHLTGEIQLLVFAHIMLIAAYLMLARSRKPLQPHPQTHVPSHAAWKIILSGLCVGIITGIIGIGGGFMIVPALVLLNRLPMRLAVGTSLCIIAMNAAAGFYKHVRELEHLGLSLNWQVINVFLLVGSVGMLGGYVVGGRLPQRTLQRVFAILLLLVALGMLAELTFTAMGK